MRRAAALIVVIALVLQPVGVGMAAGQTSDGTIVRTMAFSLTPDEPGSVSVRVTFDVPTNVLSLTTSVPGRAAVVATDGFTETDDGYTWNGGPDDPSLTLALSANRTDVGLRAAASSSGYEFVDAGPWALVSTLPMSTSWTYTGKSPDFERRVTTATDGVAGQQMVYLGPSTEYTRSASGQRVTLVVPDSATMAEAPSTVLDSIAAASASLRVGERDPAITFFAVPTSVDWAAEGLATNSEAWVTADSELDRPENVWLHEYVHTRTAFEPSTGARWLVEAAAEYYAALLTFQQGRIDFQEFHDHLALGARDPYASSILTEPSTWARGANYLKGALVLGNLDRRIRLATESRHTAADLVEAMNRKEGTVTYDFVRETVAALSGPETVQYLDRYATTQAAPSAWSRTEHAAAFQTLPPLMVVGNDPTFTVTGPSRETRTSTPPVLVPGETLAVNVSVTNEGDVAGEYDVTLTVDGEPVDSAAGSLASGESTRVTLRHQFESTGTVTVMIDGLSFDVTVADPATPHVTGLEAPESVEAGSEFALTITAENPTDRPATGAVPVVIDGKQVASWSPVVASGDTITDTKRLVIDDPGRHTVSVGDESVEVVVTDSATTAVPGFTVALWIVAFAVTTGLYRFAGRHR
ncbi:MAG: CARDB domain-containing protein [Halanaeroarchaeum sp.]